MSNKSTRATVKLDAFSKIAFWQLMVFVMLLCFVWANEIMDLPNAWFGVDPSPFNVYRGCIFSALIIVGAIVAVGHTYEQQKAVVQNLLMTCAYCHRVRTGPVVWEHVEEYFLKHYPLDVRKGICPECDTMLKDLGDRSKSEPIV